MPLFRTHPNLYLSNMLKAGWFMINGINFLLVSTSVTPFVSPRLAAIPFLAVGLILALTSQLPHMQKYRRIVLLASLALSLIWAVGFLLLYLDHAAKSYAGAILYAFQGLYMIPNILEPSINPATAERGNLTNASDE